MFKLCSELWDNKSCPERYNNNAGPVFSTCLEFVFVVTRTSAPNSVGLRNFQNRKSKVIGMRGACYRYACFRRTTKCCSPTFPLRWRARIGGVFIPRWEPPCGSTYPAVGSHLYGVYAPHLGSPLGSKRSVTRRPDCGRVGIGIWGSRQTW